MTSNKYIVNNCPCIKHYDDIELDNRCMSDQGIPFFCENNPDCVIKQVITICKGYKMSKEDMQRSKEFADIIRGSKYGSDALAIQILQLFDIEEINK